MKGYLIQLAETTGKLPTVIVIHENLVLNPHIRDVVARMALEGFVAFASDYLSSLASSSPLKPRRGAQRDFSGETAFHQTGNKTGSEGRTDQAIDAGGSFRKSVMLAMHTKTVVKIDEVISATMRPSASHHRFGVSAIRT